MAIFLRKGLQLWLGVEHYPVGGCRGVPDCETYSPQITNHVFFWGPIFRISVAHETAHKAAGFLSFADFCWGRRSGQEKGGGRGWDQPTNQPNLPPPPLLTNQPFGEAAAERKKLFRTKSQLMAEEEEERRKARGPPELT